MARTKGFKSGAVARKPEQDGHGQPAVPAGTEVWQTASKLTSGGSLNEMSKYDRKTSKFSNTVNIQHTDASTLTPLLVTQGLLAGKHILVLDPIKTFGFLDLPAEIRVMIYRYLVVESGAVNLSTFTPVGGARRLVRLGFEDRKAHSSKGMKFDERVGKYVGQTPSNFAIACTNKQIATEVCPVIYGDNTFQFQTLGELDVFLSDVNSMRAHLKHLAVVGHKCYTHGRGRTTFDKLLPATNLPDLSISHRGIATNTQGLPRTGRVSVQKSIDDARPFLRGLHKAVMARNAQDASSGTVLDIVKIVVGETCGRCTRGIVGLRCEDRDTAQPVCGHSSMDTHVRGVAAVVRKAIAKESRIDG